MQKYRVKINGDEYEVEVEKVDGESLSANKPKVSAAPKASPSSGGRGEQVLAPLPGTILSVNVTSGQPVKKGQILMILEAMKMENEIMAPTDGTVGTVSVKSGDSVESGALLCTFLK